MKTRTTRLIGLIVILGLTILGAGTIFRSGIVANAYGPQDYNTNGSTCSQAVLNYVGPDQQEITAPAQLFLRANVGSDPTNYDSGGYNYVGQNPFTLTVGLPSGIAPGTTIYLYVRGYPDDVNNGDAISTSYICSNVSAGSSGGRPPSFTDGRINNEEQWQTAAIWCDGDDVLVYRVIDSVGQYAFRATKAEVDAARNSATKPALVKQALGVSLYVDASGGLTVMSPNLDPTKSDPYTFSWSGCPL